MTSPACLTLSYEGKKNKLRVYYLSWLRNKILHNDPEVEKKQGWVTVGDLEGAVHYKVGMSHLQHASGQYIFAEKNWRYGQMSLHTCLGTTVL